MLVFASGIILCLDVRGFLKMIGPSSKTWILAVWAAGTFAVLTAVALFPV
jgi:hypothetical protein